MSAVLCWSVEVALRCANGCRVDIYKSATRMVIRTGRYRVAALRAMSHFLSRETLCDVYRLTKKSDNYALEDKTPTTESRMTENTDKRQRRKRKRDSKIPSLTFPTLVFPKNSRTSSVKDSLPSSESLPIREGALPDPPHLYLSPRRCLSPSP